MQSYVSTDDITNLFRKTNPSSLIEDFKWTEFGSNFKIWLS